MTNKIAVMLEQQEYSALLRAFEQELRNPPDQIRHIVRTDMERRGLIEPTVVSELSEGKDVEGQLVKS